MARLNEPPAPASASASTVQAASESVDARKLPPSTPLHPPSPRPRTTVATAPPCARNAGDTCSDPRLTVSMK